MLPPTETQTHAHVYVCVHLSARFFHIEIYTFLLYVAVISMICISEDFFFGIASTLSSSASINRTCAMAIVANAKTAIQHKAYVRRHHHRRYSKIFRRQMLNT